MDKKRKITLFIYMVAALIISFLAGKMFGESLVIESVKSEPPRVYIEQQKTQLKITPSQPEIEIFVDGQRYASPEESN